MKTAIRKITFIILFGIISFSINAQSSKARYSHLKKVKRNTQNKNISDSKKISATEKAYYQLSTEADSLTSENRNTSSDFELACLPSNKPILLENIAKAKLIESYTNNINLIKVRKNETKKKKEIKLIINKNTEKPYKINSTNVIEKAKYSDKTNLIKRTSKGIGEDFCNWWDYNCEKVIITALIVIPIICFVYFSLWIWLIGFIAFIGLCAFFVYAMSGGWGY